MTKQEIEAAADAMYVAGCAGIKWDVDLTIPWRKSPMLKAWLAIAKWHCEQMQAREAGK